MIKWNSLSTKIPNINTYVYMLSNTLKTVGYGKLCVFLNSMSAKEGGFFKHFDVSHGLVEGDIFWKIYGEQVDIEDNVSWGKIEDFPYWITEDDLAKFVVENRGVDEVEVDVEEVKVERSQILDIRE